MKKTIGPILAVIFLLIGDAFYVKALACVDDVGRDPYQDIYNDRTLKTYLMKRVANDPAGAADPCFENPMGTVTTNQPRGVFLQTDDENDLNPLFQNIARRIQLRLVR